MGQGQGKWPKKASSLQTFWIYYKHSGNITNILEILQTFWKYYQHFGFMTNIPDLLCKI